MSNFHNDQAAGLRRIMAAPKPRVVSIISAAATHDQPRMMTNLAASIGNQGCEVLIVHASQDSRESGYGTNKLPSLFDVADEGYSVANAVGSSSHGFYVTKLMQKSQFNTSMLSDVSKQVNHIFNELARQYEIVLVDATLNENHLLPLKILNEGEIIIQLTRQPESIKQAYTLIKQICSQLGRRPFGIIVDDATDAQAQIVFRNISQVARRFMQIELEFFGAIPNDDHLSRAAKLGRSVIDAFPMASASSAFKQIAQRLDYKNGFDADIKQASFI
ncbi:MotR [Methylotenera sp.]|jgi:flagellar biosynthesis protein FlhG|uniref:MinD/ParA family ATP-binding protein n=1 Tax=Methylotenera sp. TaxID=2051956 RepID=UPI0027302887|nr:MotR [Methylotenera sp.]MDP2229586.1 MotR [Methylotenera sp.]MDP3141502.1 MotR [Methylotenera sp.]